MIVPIKCLSSSKLFTAMYIAYGHHKKNDTKQNKQNVFHAISP